MSDAKRAEAVRIIAMNVKRLQEEGAHPDCPLSIPLSLAHWEVLLEAEAVLFANSLPPEVSRALMSQDLYSVLMDVQNGIDSPGLKMMANSAIRGIDKARAALQLYVGESR